MRVILYNADAEKIHPTTYSIDFVIIIGILLIEKIFSLQNYHWINTFAYSMCLYIPLTILCRCFMVFAFGIYTKKFINKDKEINSIFMFAMTKLYFFKKYFLTPSINSFILSLLGFIHFYPKNCMFYALILIIIMSVSFIASHIYIMRVKEFCNKNQIKLTTIYNNKLENII